MKDDQVLNIDNIDNSDVYKTYSNAYCWFKNDGYGDFLYF